MGRKVVCNYCHGNKVIQRQKSNGTWVTETCPACKGRGVVDTSTI